MCIYTTPYTYLIRWSTHNKWYYGVRFGKGCNPADLWTTYFTSSKRVKLFRELNGEPDIIQVRKIFKTPKEALLWEEKVLKRCKVVYDNKWHNIASTTGKFHTDNMIFITNGDQHIMIDKDMPIPHGWRLGKSDKSIENYKKGASKRPWHFPDSAYKKSIEKRKNSIIITNDIVNIYHHKDEPIPEGFRKGLSKDICEKRSMTIRGKKWYTDGETNIRSFECPIGFKPGMIHKKKNI
jgi:hypothetical protein